MADLKISQLTGATTPLAGTEVLPIVQSSSTKKVAVSDLTAGRSVSMLTLAVTGSSSQLSSEVFRTSATSFMRIAGGSAAATGATILAFGESHASAPGRLSLNAVGAGYAELGSGDGSYNLRLSSTGDATLSNGNLVIGTSGKGIDFSATPGTGTSELLADYEEGTWTPTLTGGTTNPTGLSFSGGATGKYTKVGRLVTVSMYFGAITWTTPGTGVFFISGLPFSGADAFTPVITSACSVQPTAVNGVLNNPNSSAYLTILGSTSALDWATAVSGGQLSFFATYIAA
jgi:hypothetical protein